MFFLYAYIKKVTGGGGKVGLIQEWGLFDILGGGHLLESELQ